MPSTYAPTPGLSGSSLAWKKWSVLSAVFATSCSCARFTASVSSVPAATLVIWRSLPSLPTETLLSRPAIEPAPRATLSRPLASEPAPSAVAPSAVANAHSPSDVLLSPLAQLFQPHAVAYPPVAHAPLTTGARTEERRGGKEWGRPCRSRWSADTEKKKK